MRSGRDIERLKGTFRKFDRRALPITRGSNYLIRANTKKRRRRTMRKRKEEDKKKRCIPASDGEDEKRSGGELDRRARSSGDELESTSEKKVEVKKKWE